MTSPYTEGLVVTGMNREFKNVQFKIKELLSCAVLYIMFTLYSHFIFLDKRKITLKIVYLIPEKNFQTHFFYISGPFRFK